MVEAHTSVWPCGVVDDLHEEVPRRAVDDQTRTLAVPTTFLRTRPWRRARETARAAVCLPNAVLPAMPTYQPFRPCGG